MTKQEAFYAWLSSFSPSANAYAEGSVPNGAELPYITFSWSQAQTFEETSITATIYARTESTKKLEELGSGVVEALAHGGVTLQCDEGLLWLTSGSPTMQYFDLEQGIKGCFINMNIQFLTL